MILLYHNIVPDDSSPHRWRAGRALTKTAFERQFHWLAMHNSILPLNEYLTAMHQTTFRKRKPVAVTFDDGYEYTFRCIYPYLLENQTPVTIFLSTGHIENGELLWFSYLKGLCFEGLYDTIEVDRVTFPLSTPEQREHAWDELRRMARLVGDPVAFCRTVAESYPLNPGVSALYAGMTHGQIEQAVQSGLVEIGAHTIQHPYLDCLSYADQKREIYDSKRILSDLTGKPVRYFAYPGGEYDQTTLEIVKQSGYEGAFAIIPQRLGAPLFEIERIGIYSQSFLKFQLKIMGVADLARLFGLRVG